MARRETPPETALAAYWERVATRYAAADPLGVVCYPGAPRWFNRFYAHFQRRAVERMLADVPLRGVRALDVGCGSGRWSRWLAERGATTVGIDPTEAMLDVARRLSPGIEFQRMSATAIELTAASVDVVVAVTVVQHLRPEEQERAADAMARVVRPGGHLFTLDLIDRRDPGRTVFPRAPEAWVELYTRHGLDLVCWEGEEYAPLMRALARLLPRGGERDAAAPARLEIAGRYRAAIVALWPLVAVSWPLELACARWLPRERARHGAFLFRKPQST